MLQLIKKYLQYLPGENIISYNDGKQKYFLELLRGMTWNVKRSSKSNQLSPSTDIFRAIFPKSQPDWATDPEICFQPGPPGLFFENFCLFSDSFAVEFAFCCQSTHFKVRLTQIEASSNQVHLFLPLNNLTQNISKLLLNIFTQNI